MEELSLTDRAYQQIRSAIVTERFPSGMAMMETKLSETIGFSRTPVREALRRLELEGYVKRDEGGRLIVHRLSATEIADLFEVRELLQSFAITLATERISDTELQELEDLAALDRRALSKKDLGRLASLNREIHDKILVASRNRVLQEVVQNLESVVHGFTAVAVGVHSDQEKFVGEHGRLVDLVRIGDSAAAARLMRSHIRRARELLLEGLEENGRENIRQRQE